MPERLNMEVIVHPERYQLHKQVFDLSVCCPFDHKNPSACPLHEVRRMRVMEKYEWLHQLSNEDMIKLLNIHQTCLSSKML